jgi:uncharacterized membrane protein (UPF0127 family)
VKNKRISFFKRSGDKENQLLLNNVELANTFLTRFKGLMFRQSMADIDGMLITPCNAIHTIGMKFNIDIVFIDKQNKVTSIKSRMSKNSFTKDLSAKHVLELPAGRLEQTDIKPGDYIHWH